MRSSISRKFKVSFGYICGVNADNTLFGKLEEKSMSFKEVEYLLKIISPLNFTKWIESLKLLRKGSFQTITFQENTDYGIVNKVLKIER